MASDERIFFESVVAFAPIADDGLIKTKDFLEAAKCIVQFVDLLGTTFKPVKSDINGNITKLTQLFESDKVQYAYLNDIVKVEKATLQPSEFHIGTDALTWLNRALVYNLLFLQQFLLEYQAATTEEAIESLPEDISRHFTLAYELSLKKHHGWFIQKIFSVCLMAAPDRTSLLTYLGYMNGQLSSMERKDLICRTIESYVAALKQNTDAVSILLLSHGFQP